MSTTIQRSLAGGELTPALHARVDISKYQYGLKTCRNMFIMRHGGATNRPGTKFVGKTRDDNKKSRLIDFIFSSTQTYIIELGHLYMRIIKEGAYLIDTIETAITPTTSNPWRINKTGHNFNTGDSIYIDDTSVSFYNNRNYIIIASTANTFDLADLNGVAIDASASIFTTSMGTATKYLQVDSPYGVDQIFDVQYVQSGDVMTFAHRYYNPKDLSRISESVWTLTNVIMTTNTFPPAGAIVVTGGGGTGYTHDYYVTSINSSNFEESFVSSLGTIANKALPTVAVPIVVSWTLVSSGVVEYNVYKVENGINYLLGVSGPVAFKDIGQSLDYTKTSPTFENFLDGDEFVLNGGTNANPCELFTSVAHSYVTGDEVIINGQSEMREINGNVYKVVVTGAAAFTLQDTDGNNIDSTNFGTFAGTCEVTHVLVFPGVVSYYQQRLVFASSVLFPDEIQMSQTGIFKNFVRSRPVQSDSSILFTMAGRQLSEIRHILDLGKMVVMTDSGEFVALGDEAGGITPTSINIQQESYNGSSYVRPIVVDKTALYVQARNTIVKDLVYNFSVDGYKGNDLTIFASHLFDDFTIVDSAYQKIPHSIGWFVRSDGVLLSLTYNREQSMVAWARHDFQGGAVESVAVIPEGNLDVLYLSVRRVINGITRRYVERMSNRNLGLIEDATFMDSFLTYDGRNTTTTTITIFEISGWDPYGLVDISGTNLFLPSDVGNVFEITSASGDVVRITVDSYVNASNAKGFPNKTVPASLQTTATAIWTKQVDVVSGLGHLVGKDVSVFADGYVVSSPQNSSYPTLTVTTTVDSSGLITLPKPYGVIHVGLPYICDIETLDIDDVGSETMQDKSKIISRVTLTTEETRGVWAGAKPPSNDLTDPLEGLSELKIRKWEPYESPVDLASKPVDINIQPEWNSNGRVFIRQVDPLPMTVLSIAPAGLIPYRKRGT